MTARPCLWCDEPFTPRATGGKRQRFCSERCRRDFDRGRRAWAELAVSSELLPVSALKHALCQRARSFSCIPAPNPTGTPDRSSRRPGASPAPAPLSP